MLRFFENLRVNRSPVSLAFLGQARFGLGDHSSIAVRRLRFNYATELGFSFFLYFFLMYRINGKIQNIAYRGKPAFQNKLQYIQDRI